MGEWNTATIGHGNGNKIEIKKELNFPHSVGLLYSAFTYFLGFTVNSGEYKLMGLAPYGNPNSAQTKEFIKKIRFDHVDVFGFQDRAGTKANKMTDKIPQSIADRRIIELAKIQASNRSSKSVIKKAIELVNDYF